MPQYVSHRVISLKGNAELNERWLQDTIAADPTILGLELLAKNRRKTYRLVLGPGDVEEHSELLDLIRLSRDAYGG